MATEKESRNKRTVAERVADMLVKDEMLRPNDDGISFLHLECASRVQLGKSIFWVFDDDVVPMPLGTPAGLNPPIQVTTYAKMLDILEDEDKATNLIRSTCVLDTHGGDYPPRFTRLMGRMLCRFGEMVATEAGAYPSIIVLGQRLPAWVEDEQLEEFFPFMSCCRSPALELKMEWEEADTAADMTDCLLKEAVQLLGRRDERRPNLVSTMMPLEECLLLYNQFRTGMYKHSFVDVCIIRKDKHAQDLATTQEALSAKTCVIVLVDSSIRFPPSLHGDGEKEGAQHRCVLPESVPLPQWDPRLGKVVLTDTAVTTLSSMCYKKPSDPNGEDPVTSLASISEDILWAIASFYKRDIGRGWMTLGEVPLLRFWNGCGGNPKYESAFCDAVWMLWQKGLIVVPENATGESIMNQRGLTLTESGQVANRLLCDGLVRTVEEAVLVMAAREESPGNAYVIAAVAALLHVGFRSFMTRSNTTAQEKNTCQHLITERSLQKSLVTRGRLWLLLGILCDLSHRYDSFDGFDDECMEDNIEKVNEQMARILGVPTASLQSGYMKRFMEKQLSTEDDILRIETALVRAMINNLVFLEPNPDGQRTMLRIREVVTGFDAELYPFGWADDQEAPESMSLGIHFGLVKDTEKGTYMAIAPMMVSGLAVGRVFDELWPAERFGGQRPNHFDLLRRCRSGNAY
ncbi:hypothetical protein QBC40DRAFT_258928 [Triangularia verruculosa]|uniref:Uncharacterized protein n=1 Tax=Triangularia verruculosa TaxID=2587418 RepID=A0AAN7AQK8_9PEZI|nr:hypothetical protein QBC40DRAFT_258928 [Triangularia verruculosa]